MSPMAGASNVSASFSPNCSIWVEKVMESEGALLGKEVIPVMSNTTHTDVAPAISSSQKTVTRPGRRRLDNAREDTPGSYKDGAPVHIRLGVLCIGSIALGSANAEIYAAIGLEFKAASPLAYTKLVTIANGAANSGYVPNDAPSAHTPSTCSAPV